MKRTILAALFLGLSTLALAKYHTDTTNISGPPTPGCRIDCGY